jgi:hypothetical protein
MSMSNNCKEIGEIRDINIRALAVEESQLAYDKR